MYLQEINLTNYRPYYETQTINLDYSSEQNFNVIFGNNTRGKTSLLNGITWAFYGKEKHDSKKKNNPIYNKLIAKKCEINEEFNVKVELKLYDYDENKNKQHFLVIRENKYKKEKNNKIKKIESLLKVKDFDGKHHEGKKAQEIIDSNISKIMHKYFFFNGEELKDYFDKEDIKKTVEKISQLNLINTVSKHLKYVQGIYFSEIQEKTVSSTPILNEIQTKTKEKENLLEENKGYKEAIRQLKQQIKSAEEEFEELEESKELFEKRKEYRKSKNENKNKLKEIENKYKIKVIDLFCILSLFDILHSTSKVNIKIPEKSALKYEVLKELYENILSDDTCICGSDFSTHPKCKDIIEKRIELLETEFNSENIENETSNDFRKRYDVITSIKSLLKTISDKYEYINELRNQITELKEKIMEIDEKINEISISFTEGDDVKISQLETSIKESTSKCEEYHRKQETCEEKLNSLKKELEKLEIKKDEVLKQEEEVKFLNEQMNFSKKAHNIISILDDELKKDVLNQLKDKIRDQFVKTNWSEGKFKDINIDDDYKVLLTDFLDDEIFPGDLTGGEERLLVLSFIISLNNISGFDLPLFIDAPLSTLDDENSLKFMRNLHKFSKDKQIIFLFIGDKYDENIENMIKEHLNKKVELVKLEEYKTKTKQIIMEKNNE